MGYLTFRQFTLSVKHGKVDIPGIFKREVKNMDKNNEIFEVTKIISNVRNNNYTVGDYKLCESESKVVLRALEEYLANIKFDGLEVVNTLESAI